MEILGWIVGIVFIVYIIFQLCGLAAGALDLFSTFFDKNHKS